MKRLLVVVTLVAAGCGGGRDPSPEPAPSPAAPSRFQTPLPTAPSAALVEAASVAGLRLGATKAEAAAVLGTPTSERRDTDVGGSAFDSLRWDFDDDGGLILNFRTGAGTSARLTDWTATAPGPHTESGVEVEDTAAEVEAGYGPLEPFCCDAKVASVASGAGRMIIVVDDVSKQVTRIIGGDERYWSRSIAD